MLVDFICPDGERISVKDCLGEGGCRRKNRCASRTYLKMAASDRPWKGKPSTTQLIGGTMLAFLKLTKDYAVSPDSRAFAIHGTKAHKVLEDMGDEYSLLEEKFDDEITGIADALECENGKNILSDIKTAGSYKVAKALGFKIIEEDTGQVFKSGKNKGEKKMRKILTQSDEYIDRWEWELQLNLYRIMFERRGFKVDEIRIMCVARDGGTFIARSRGVFRNVYYFNINRLPDKKVLAYFNRKKKDLETALSQGYWNDTCTAEENWDGLRCASYCEVAEFCPLGKYLKKEKVREDMAIKNLSEIRRLPRLGKIRLGIKKKAASGKEYPAEVDYFILAPQTPSELENKKLTEEFERLYGKNPKQIKIMLPLPDLDIVFPQDYKRYGSGAMLKCKGDGETAVCSKEEYAAGLELIGKDEMGMTKVKCLGKDCIYQQDKSCARVGVLQVLLPELPGAGVWQIPTGSFNSMVNINSCLEYIRAVCGRFHMIPLTLERRQQEMAHDGKKRTHFILHINMDFPLANLQKFAMIDATKILLELPEPEAGKEEILLQDNIDVEEAKVVEEPKQEVNPETKPDNRYSEMLKTFAKAKEAIGEEAYYRVLGNAGFSKSNQIRNITEGNKVLDEMRKIATEKK